MKKIILLAAVVAGAILPASAHAANEANGAVALNASVNPTCAIRGIAQTTAGASTTGVAAGTPAALTALNSVATLNGASLSYSPTGLFDATTAATNAVSNTLTISAFCNYGTHNISLQSASGGMVNTSGVAVAAAGTFVERVNYLATLTGWGTAADVTLDTVAANNSRAVTLTTGTAIQSTPAVNTATATLKIDTKAVDTLPALQGTYADTLRIRLGTTF